MTQTGSLNLRRCVLHQLSFSPHQCPQPLPQVATGECVSVVWARQWVSAAGRGEQIIPCGSPLKAPSSPRPSHRLMAWWLNSDALSSLIIKGRAEHCWERVSFNKEEKKKNCIRRKWREVNSKPTDQTHVLNSGILGGNSPLRRLCDAAWSF